MTTASVIPMSPTGSTVRNLTFPSPRKRLPPYHKHFQIIYLLGLVGLAFAVPVIFTRPSIQHHISLKNIGVIFAIYFGIYIVYMLWLKLVYQKNKDTVILPISTRVGTSDLHTTLPNSSGSVVDIRRPARAGTLASNNSPPITPTTPTNTNQMAYPTYRSLRTNILPRPADSDSLQPHPSSFQRDSFGVPMMSPPPLYQAAVGLTTSPPEYSEANEIGAETEEESRMERRTEAAV